jgi:hypothetical protein
VRAHALHLLHVNDNNHVGSNAGDQGTRVHSRSDRRWQDLASSGWKLGVVHASILGGGGAREVERRRRRGSANVGKRGERKCHSRQMLRTSRGHARFGRAASAYVQFGDGIFPTPVNSFAGHACLQDLLGALFCPKLKISGYFTVLPCLQDLLKLL